MQGDSRVEKYMGPVAAELDRHFKRGDPAHTAIYNRAYEAVMTAIRDCSGPTNADTIGGGLKGWRP